MNVLKFFFGITTLFTLFSPATILFAEVDPSCGDAFGSGEICYAPLTQIPGITNIVGTNGQTTGNTSDPAEMVTGFYKFAIGIASVGAVVMIMWGGLEYMTTEAFTGKSNAKNRITYALVGLILLLSSYIILRTINRDLITFKLTLPQGSKFLSDAASAQKAAQEKIDNLSSQTAAGLRLVNEKRQALDSVKGEITLNEAQIAELSKKTPLTDGDKAIIKQLEEKNKTLATTAQTKEKEFYQTVSENQEKIGKLGFETYLNAGDVESAKRYLRTQQLSIDNGLKALEIEKTKLNGQDADLLAQKMSTEETKSSLTTQKTALEEKLKVSTLPEAEKTKLNNDLAVINNDLQKTEASLQKIVDDRTVLAQNLAANKDKETNEILKKPDIAFGNAIATVQANRQGVGMPQAQQLQAQENLMKAYNDYVASTVTTQTLTTEQATTYNKKVEDNKKTILDKIAAGKPGCTNYEPIFDNGALAGMRCK